MRRAEMTGLIKGAAACLVASHLVAATTEAGAAGKAAVVIAGPVAVEVADVYDGDTFTAVAAVWPGHAVTTGIRVRGVDAPEIKGRCPAENDAARRAAEFTRAFLAGGGVTIRDIAPDKFGGRMDADVSDGSGRDLGRALVQAGLARPYNGGKRAGWCD